MRARSVASGWKHVTTSAMLMALVWATACVSHPSVQVQSPRVSSAATDTARAFIRALVERERLPGLAITVNRGGRVIWHEGIGFADLEARTPVTPGTRFRIGSLSKLLTAMTLMRLSQAGVVDLDAPIAQYMAALPPHLRDIDLRQLAGHIAGIRHYRGNEFLSALSCETLREGLAVFTGDTLVAVPETRYAYSSYGYNLIGAVLESATRRPFAEIVRRQVLIPLEMEATVPDSKAERDPHRARTYAITASGLAAAPADDLSCRWPSGGYLSSTDDLAKLGSALMTPGLLSSASLERMLTPQRTRSGKATSVGIGWRVSVDSSGRRYFHHGGSSNGGAAFLLVYPQEQLVVALASNAFARWGERDALAVASIFIDTSR